MSLTILTEGTQSYRLFYSSIGFKMVTVTGYVIYPDATKSVELTFTGLGDGIYYVDVQHQRKTNLNVEKHGMVIKEDGVPMKFEVIHIQN